MSTPLLATKLYIPPARPNLVHRARLIERLTTGLQGKLTLISAPAGFGKTTLISEWVAGIARPAAWLSLDEEDNDPIRFLTYLIAALQTLERHRVPGAPVASRVGMGGKIGEGVLAMLQSAQPPATEALLTALLNEITTLPDHLTHPALPHAGRSFVLVLDDYQMIEAKAVDQALSFLLEHLPPQLHLVITTREDPHLPLARLRARGQMTELRAADLRFSAAEATEFLNQVMGLRLSVADVAALEERTEGWIAGLQLAALSMRDHQDIHGFIRGFAGDHRYIVDYLVEEVLQRQPTPVRNFLLRTAILDRLNGPLCDAVTGGEGSNARLEALERGNFFVVPLDDKRHWYRYHHLFAEVLAAHLRAEQPDQVATLHRRASVWYEAHGAVADAIHHALAAAGFARAADLIERAMPAMRQSREEAIVFRWLQALPDELIRARPVLSVGYGWVLLARGELDGIEPRLRDAEKALTIGLNSKTSAVIVNEEEIRRLPGLIALFRAGRALTRGDWPGTVQYAQRALDLAPKDDTLWQGAAVAILGIASWASGDLEVAYRTYTDGMASVQQAGNISDAISGTIARADIRVAQGHLREAMGIYEQALQLATAHQPGDTRPILRGTADLYVGMSELHCEHNDLNTATQQLLRSKELGEQRGLPQNRSRWAVAMARIREAQGDLDGALDLLHEAERLYVSDFFPNVRPIAALKARLWIAQRRLGEALGWVRQQGLSPQDDLSYLHEFEYITLARVLLAQVQHNHADQSMLETIGLLARLLQAAEAGGRMGSVIEILLLQALAYYAQDDLPTALVPLQQALMLAEPEGYVRLFVDEGAPMATLLSAAVERGMMVDYSHKLLVTLGTVPPMISNASPPLAAPISSAPHTQLLIEPLSERELEVLRLLTTDLSGPEIARQLMISLNTLRTHTKNIFSKLAVNNRRAAVRRAEELDLL